MKMTYAFLILGLFSAFIFQNCGGKKVDFVTEEAAIPSEAPAVITPQKEQEEEIELKGKTISFYGTRIQGQLALVAELSDPTTLPLTVSLSKSCGTLTDDQVSGDGMAGKFIFKIAAGQKQSSPVILSAFPSGQIVWAVKIQVTNSGSVVTDIVQSCSPWLKSNGGDLCPAPANQPYCLDRG